MKKRNKTYGFCQKASALFMILTLCWLTVSTPFVYRFQQEHALAGHMANSQSPLAGNEEEAAKPLTNNTEEKTSGNTSLTEEFLHDSHASHNFMSVARFFHTLENDRVYIAYHGELLVPPPNTAC